MRLLLASVALIACAGVPVAAADTGTSCATIVDDQGGLVELSTGEPWRDLRSATVGSDSQDVTVVLQLAALPATPSRAEHALVDYSMRFTVGGQTAFLTVPAHEGAAASYGVAIAFRPLVLGEATVVRDRDRQQLRVTAPIAAFAPHADLRPGGTASNINAYVAVTPSPPGATPVTRAQALVVDGVYDEKATYRLGDGPCAAAPA